MDKAPYKVTWFSWLVVKEVVLTHDILSKRGIQLCSRCHLCGKEADYKSMFLHCRMIRKLRDCSSISEVLVGHYREELPKL